MLCKAQCPACGVVLDVDDGNGAAICTACATPFVTQQGIDRYANSHHSRNLESEIQRANAFLQVGEWNQAYDVFKELTALYPHDARVWLGVARAMSQERTCHTIDSETVAEIKSYVEKSRLIYMHIADNSWDAYIENEEHRLEYEAQAKDAYRRKLQREYDETVKRAQRHLNILILNKLSMFKTYLSLGIVVTLLGVVFFIIHILQLVATPLAIPQLFMYIGAGTTGLGVILMIMGLASNPRKVSLPANDSADIQRTVERITLSAQRQGVEIDMSVPIQVCTTPRK